MVIWKLTKCTLISAFTQQTPQLNVGVFSAVMVRFMVHILLKIHVSMNVDVKMIRHLYSNIPSISLMIFRLVP